MKVCFETFGCRLNKAEALQMEADYIAKGWEVTATHEDAQMIVVRGCSVTESAQRDCERLIAHLKRKYPTTPLRLCGCLDLKRLRDLGFESKALPLAALESLRRRRNQQSSSASADTSVPTRTARAYLKVQDGCAGTCTFCIVPKFRGKSVSVPFSDALDRAKRFIDAGYHEIVVTGCNLSLYASDGQRLPELLAALAELDLVGCRIRLGSVEPGACARETVHAMAEHENACRFLHIPVQSGSSMILRAMGRPYLPRDVDLLASEARKLMPTICLGCDLMTGFPGETDLEHRASVAMVNRLRFANAHVFPFSARPGTPAAKLKDSVSSNQKSKRAHELIRLATSIREEFAKSFLGKKVAFVVEDAEKSAGWSGEYLRCRPLVGTAERKSLASLLVTKVEADRLYGRLAKA